MKKIILLSILFILFPGAVLSQWQSDVRLTNNPSVSITSENNAWNIASSSDTLHISWNDKRNGNYEIYYKRSVNRGISWSADTRLTNDTSYSGNSSIAVSGQIVHIVWNDMRDGNYEIYYKRSTDAGLTWSTDIRLTNNPYWSVLPSLTILGAVVHAVWADERDGNMEIYYKRSTDAGITWEPDLRITNITGYSYLPSVSASGPYLHVAWWDNHDNNREIYYRRSYDGGSTWSAVMRLTNDPAESNSPSIASSGLYVHVIWSDNRDGNSEIYYKQSTNGGGIWGPDIRLTNNSAGSVFSSICVSGQAVHIVFQDARDGNFEIYYKRSNDRGLTWAGETRLTNNSAWSSDPSLAVSGTSVNVVWCDERDTNWEVYFKQDPTGNPFITVPLPPNLISPLNGAYNQSTNVRFIWNKSQYSVTYRLQVALDSLFTNLVLNDSTLTDSTIVVTNLTVDKYYWWRVNAKNTYGTSQYSAVWKFGTFFVGLEPISSDIPDKFSLEQNYPNPFNPSTKIRFALPPSPQGEGLGVRVIIYDILGNEISVPVNEQLMPGYYEIEFDGSKFASGIYFYRIETSVFTDTKKMVLLK